MPQRKKASDISGSRGRSKSTGRSAPKNRQHSSRSRTRSRSKTPTRRARTPASESIVRRRHSSSSEREALPLKSGILDASGDHKTKFEIMKTNTRSTNHARMVQNVPKKVDVEQIRSVSKEKLNSKLESSKSVKRVNMLEFAASCCKMFPTSASVAVFQFMMLIPFVYWLTLLSFTPVGEIKTDQPIWGPTLEYLGVLWPTKLNTYINIQSLIFIVIYIFVHYVFARFLPAGQTECRINGILTTVFFLGILEFSEFSQFSRTKGWQPSLMLPKYLLSLMTACYFLAGFLSIIAFFVSNPSIRTTRQSSIESKNVLLCFWFGRSARFHWFNVNWKIVALRFGKIGLVLIELTYATRQQNLYGRLSPALAFHALVRLFLLFDAMIFEHTTLFTYEIQNRNFGLVTLLESLVGLPFLVSIPASYLSLQPDIGRLPDDSSIHSCNYSLLGFSLFVFLLGYWIYRGSTNQKYRFILEPHHPSFAQMETIAGPSSSQRLMLGGWWGLIRHPNYIGTMAMTYATTIPCGCESIIPWLHPILLTLFFCYRVWLIEDGSSKRYGPAWQKYVALVPYRFIPKIY